MSPANPWNCEEDPWLLLQVPTLRDGLLGSNRSLKQPVWLELSRAKGGGQRVKLDIILHQERDPVGPISQG